MQELKVNNWELRLFTVDEYTELYGSKAQEHYGAMVESLHTIGQLLYLDEHGDWDKTAERIIIGFAQDKWAYVETKETIIECTFIDAVKAMLEGNKF